MPIWPSVNGKPKRSASGRDARPIVVQDIRKLLEDKSIDIVTVATPNHWHALAAIWAMQAGKDVYLEKPVSHNVAEGRVIVDVARKTGSHLPDRHPMPLEPRHAGGDGVCAARRDRSSLRGSRPVLQTPRVHRATRAIRRPAVGRLQPLARPRPHGPDHAASVSLRLALAVRLRQR